MTSSLLSIRKIIGLITPAALLFMLISPVHSGRAAVSRLFVEPTHDVTDCTREDPCGLMVALGLAVSGDQILAAAGTYAAAAGDEVVLLDKSIDLLGGWNGLATGPILRDPDTYRSILDGWDARRVITISGGSSVQPTVDGWTIRNGNATGLINHCYSNGGNSGCGGGIHVYEAEPIISNNIIEDNTAASGEAEYASGGGIYIQGSASALIEGNTIRRNDSHQGGPGLGAGIHVYDSGGDIEIINNEIYENDDFDPASYNNHVGCGIYIGSNTGAIQVLNNYIHNNNPLVESYSGSAIAIHQSDNTVLVEGNRILDNSGFFGIVELNYSTAVIQRNTIINPSGKNGILVFDTDTHTPGGAASIYNNIIAAHEEADVSVSAYSGHTTRTQLSHNTLADAEYGLYVGSFNSTVVVTIDRSIISDNSILGVSASSNSGISVTVTNTLFNANALDCDAAVVNVNPLTGNPRFVNPSGYNYHLNRLSEAIDRVSSGGLATDIDGDPRPFGIGTLAYDVGADEYSLSDFFFLPIIIHP